MPVDRFVRRQSLQKVVVIPQQPRLVVIDIDAGRNMHGIDQYQSFFHPACAKDGFDLRGNIEIRAACLRFKPELFSIGFHRHDSFHWSSKVLILPNGSSEIQVAGSNSRASFASSPKQTIMKTYDHAPITIIA